MPEETPALPERIEPVLDAKGRPLDLSPPCCGYWLREADGGLRPRDAATAAAAGLAPPGAAAMSSPELTQE
jgi:hypothetical protein